MGVIYRNGTLYGGEVSKKELVFENFEDFPENGNEEFLYIAKDNNEIYRFENNEYIKISEVNNIQTDENRVIVGNDNNGIKQNTGAYFITSQGDTGKISTTLSTSRIEANDGNSYIENSENAIISYSGSTNIAFSDNVNISMEDDTYIKTYRDINSGEIMITIGGSGEDDEKISFTAKQIRQVLNILSPITQEEYDALNPPEEKTPYFIID